MRDPIALMKHLLERVNTFSKSKNPALKKDHRILQGPVEVLSDIDGFRSAERFFILDEIEKEWIELDFAGTQREGFPASGDIVKVEGFYRGGSFFNSEWDRLLVLKIDITKENFSKPRYSK